MMLHSYLEMQHDSTFLMMLHFYRVRCSIALHSRHQLDAGYQRYAMATQAPGDHCGTGTARRAVILRTPAPMRLGPRVTLWPPGRYVARIWCRGCTTGPAAKIVWWCQGYCLFDTASAHACHNLTVDNRGHLAPAAPSSMRSHAAGSAARFAPRCSRPKARRTP